jgi:hypothetical protein
MEDVPLETRRGIFLQHDGLSEHLGRQVTAYWNQLYENRWIGHRGPVPWPPRSPDLTTLGLLWAVTKEMTYRTKVHTREELLYQIMAPACIRGHPEMTQWAVNSCLERARLCIENRGGYFEQL